MTSNWTNGYQNEVNYTYGYYRDLSPNYQRFCLLLNGIACPETNENHNHCELGFGQGISVNVHAASHGGKFFGTDFNPSHAAHAQELARKSKIITNFYDDSFEELLNRNNFPQFNSISLHGIWSWISHENQSIILKFIRKYLKPNGVVYISYNCMTGWASNMPVRELFYSHFKYNSTSNNPLEKVQAALDFSENLLSQDSVFIKANPNTLNKVKELKSQNPNYLIHEYLNQDWQCFSFQQVVRIFDDIKLNFAGSTNLGSLLPNITFTDEQQAFLNNIDHPIVKEQCKDYFTNSQFRKDLFVRGPNNLTPLEQKEALKDISFILLVKPKFFPKNINGILGSFSLIEEIYKPLGDYLEKNDYKPQTIRELEKALPQLNYEKILNAFVILCHYDLAQPCLSEIKDERIQQCQNLNLHLIKQAFFHQNYQVLISPVTGIGIPVDHFTQLFYYAYFVEGLKTTKQFANLVQKVLDDLGWSVIDENKELVSDKQKSLKIIEDRASHFIRADFLKIAKELKLF